MVMNTDTSQELLKRNENLICPGSNLFKYFFSSKVLYERYSFGGYFLVCFILCSAVAPSVKVVRNQQLQYRMHSVHRHLSFPCAPSHLACVLASQHMFAFVFLCLTFCVCAFQQVSVSAVLVSLRPCCYVATIAVSVRAMSHGSLGAFVSFVGVDAVMLLAGSCSD